MPKALLILIAVVVVLRIITFEDSIPQNIPVRLSVKVSQEPRVFDDKRQIVIKGHRAYVDLYPEVNYGDSIIIEGIAKEGVLTKANIVSVKSSGGLYEIRQKIISLYSSALPEPHSSLVAGIVLGSKSNMPEDFWENLKTTGTAHVVVASGMNVTFIISFLLNFLVSFIKRQKAILIAVLGAWVYVVLSGFDAPLVRSAIMGSIAFGAQGTGRISNALNALFLSAGVMLLVKPEWLHDLGFILSFTATLSLIVFESKISRLLQRVPLVFKKDLATTLAAQLGVTPILLVSFGSVNIFSPFINALVLWTIPPIMIIGAASGLLGLLVSQLGQIVVLLTLPFSYWFVEIVNLFS